MKMIKDDWENSLNGPNSSEWSQNVPLCPNMSQNAHFRRIIVRMDLLVCIWVFWNVLLPLFLGFRPKVVHHPPVGKTKRQGNINFLPGNILVLPTGPTVLPCCLPRLNCASFDPFVYSIFFWILFSFLYMWTSLWLRHQPLPFALALPLLP